MDGDELGNGRFARIRIEREKRGLSQRALAQGLGCHWTLVSHWERGRYKSITVANSWGLKRLLGIPLSWWDEGVGRKGNAA